MKAKGADICNLTVGDFDPAQFPAPAALLDGMRGGAGRRPDELSALRRRARRCARRWRATTRKRLGLAYPVESVLITGGARPLLYGSYRTVLDPGDVGGLSGAVLEQQPLRVPVRRARRSRSRCARSRTSSPRSTSSARICRRRGCCSSTRRSTRPARSSIPRCCSAICELVVEENRRARERAASAQGRSGSATTRSTGSWCSGAPRHVTPPEVCADVAPYTIILDAASKSFAATGLRVGWAVMPPAARQRMADILGHVGAWAPRPEQVAMAALLDDERGGRRPTSASMRAARRRAARPAGGRVRGDAQGGAAGRGHRAAGRDLPLGPVRDSRARPTRRPASCCSTRPASRLVPFQAFGLREDSGWFRISVGAVSLAEIDAALPRVRAALARN